MLEAISKKSVVKKGSKTPFIVNRFIISPLKAGFSGFAIFFTVLIFTKLVAYGFGIYPSFEMDINDVWLSLIGFLLLFLIRLLENLSNKNVKEF
jgi:hypothetical protein